MEKQTWLENLLAEKIKYNPQFSMRAFARMVDVNPAVLSRILSGKRQLTFNLAVRIADALTLGPMEREELYAIFTERSSLLNLKDKEINLDSYHAIKDWYHYGITELLLMDSFREDYKWLAHILDISELEAKLAVERLLRLKVLARDTDGKLCRTYAYFSTTPEIAASGIKHFQKQILEKFSESLDKDLEVERSFSSITIAINEEHLDLAKKEIKKFKKTMTKLLGEGKKTRLYSLGIMLTPLSKSTLGKRCLDQ